MTHSSTKNFEHAGWRVRHKTDSKWTLICDEDYARTRNRPDYVFQEVVALVRPQDESQHKLTTDKTAAVSFTQEWLPMTELAPLGVKVHALNLGLVATHTVLTKADLPYWRGWLPLPSIPISWRS